MNHCTKCTIRSRLHCHIEQT